MSVTKTTTNVDILKINYLSEAMYQQQANPNPTENNTNPNDDVVDADFKAKE